MTTGRDGGSSAGPEGTGVGAPTSGALTATAWAGVAGPVLFTGTFLTLEVLRRDDYSPLAEPVSALEAGSYGWVQQLSFVVLGLLTVLFAAGLHRGVGPTRAGQLGPVLLGLSGLGNILAAVFPLREDAAGVTYDPGGHAVAGVLFFLTSALGLLVLSWRLRRDDRWRGLAGYSAVAGALGLLGFVLMGVLVVPDDAPLHDWAGLGQRLLVLAVLFPCRIALALRLLTVAKAKR